jgi:7,8-dihydropterin-6-yl-methyl-4-(beta-D-ribofuranosyl)aminobenzene 5'-phosphate synthase
MGVGATDVLIVDELRVTVIVDNESDTLSTIDDGVFQVPESASLLQREPPDFEHDGHPAIDVFSHLCVACHGLSVLVTARHEGDSRTLLFDVGPDGDLWLGNAERLAIDLASIDTLFLSHWHADHSGGFPTVVRAICEARASAGRPAPVVDLHPDRPDQRGLHLPSGAIALLPPEPSFDDIVAAGGAVHRHGEPHDVSRRFYASGMIDRVTAYETGQPGHVSFHDGEMSSDPLIADERFIAVHVRDRGLSILSACSHAGIVNVCLAARAAFPGVPIDMVLGGFHLAGAAVEQRIAATVDDLAEIIGPGLVAPGHCTGWRAKAALAARFAPGRYGPSVVGTRYVLAAPS